MARKILDTGVEGEQGTEVQPTQHQAHGRPILGIVHAQLSTGDVVVIYGRADTSLTERAMVTISSTTEPPFEMTLPPNYRAARTTDGGVGESKVFVEELLQ